MTLDINDLFTPATAAQWETTLLGLATTLGLQTTAWQPGSVVRTFIAIMSNALAAGDQVVSVMNQGTLLDFASAITTDPSVAGNENAKPGWLDFLAQSNFDVARTPATASTGPIHIVNASASTYGPYAVGTYHVDNPSTKQSYHNTAVLTISPSTTTVATFAADLAGSAGTSAPSTITHAITSNIGVTVTNPGSLVGANAQGNDSLVAACRAKFASRSPNGPHDAYRFFAIAAAKLLAAETPSVVISPITQVLVETDKNTGVVTTTVANAQGPVPGVTNLGVTGATNATPIEITTASNHGLNTGDWVTVSGVEGNSGANITSTIAVTASNKFTLDLGVGTGSYTTGGIVEGGDLGEVDRILQENVVPNGVTALTVSATEFDVTVDVTVWVPQANVGIIASPVSASIAAYISRVPIGGYTDPGGAYTNVIPIDAVIGASFAGGVLAPGVASVVQQATVLLNSGSVDLPMTSHQVAHTLAINVTVHGV